MRVYVYVYITICIVLQGVSFYITDAYIYAPYTNMFIRVCMYRVHGVSSKSSVPPHMPTLATNCKLLLSLS